MEEPTYLEKVIHNTLLVYKLELTVKHQKKYLSIKMKLEDGTATFKDCQKIVKVIWKYKPRKRNEF